MTFPIPTAGRVVVGTDASPTARHAVDWAAVAAAKRKKPLLVLVAGGEASDTAASEALRVREAHPDLEVETAITTDDPSDALVAASADAELVVVGARGASAPLRVRALGGVADQVVTHALGQVMVVPEGSSEREGPVVVGVDDSPEAAEAVKVAFGAASRTGQPLRALHILPQNLGASRAWAAAGITGDDLLEPSDQMIDEILAPAIAAHPEVKVTKELVWGHPAKVLLDASQEAYIVVVGSRGRGGFAGLLLGSTSRELLRHSAAPVLVLRRGIAVDSE